MKDQSLDLPAALAFAQRAFTAAAILARPAADILPCRLFSPEQHFRSSRRGLLPNEHEPLRRSVRVLLRSFAGARIWVVTAED